MKNFLKKYGGYLICLCFSFFLIFTNSKEKQILQKAKKNTLETLTPVLDQASTGLYSIFNLEKNLANLFAQKQKIEDLEKKNEFLEYYFYLYKQLAQENETLKEDLNYYEKTKANIVTGKIIARNNASPSNEALINIGLKEGIKKNQLVLYRHQLFGRIIDVNENNSRVLLLSSTLSRIPAISFYTKEKFMVAGQNLNHFACLYLNDKSSLKEGELVFTSDVDVKIPSNILIGFTIRDGDNFYVKPVFDQTKVEYVQVLKDDLAK